MKTKEQIINELSNTLDLLQSNDLKEVCNHPANVSRYQAYYHLLYLYGVIAGEPYLNHKPQR